jgi:predicted ATPase
MITSIKISNFYGFDQADVLLHHHLNILIGINGSGKSNFLRAVKLLKEGVWGVGLKKYIFDSLGGFDNLFFKGNLKTNPAQVITIQYTIDANALTKGGYGYRFVDDLIYEISIHKSPSLQNFYIEERVSTSKGFVYLEFSNGIGHLSERTEVGNKKSELVRYNDFDPQELALSEVSDTDRYYALTTLKKAMRDIMVYDYFDTTPQSPIRKPMLPSSEKRLFADGANLPQILNTIKINHKSSYRLITELLNEVNPNFLGFDFNFIGGNIELMLEEKGLESAVHVSSISDGTLRYLCLLAILFNPDRGRFICLDEPEVGLHPDMILNIANAIKLAAENSTILVSTHSENLLNHFEIEHVKVFEKDDNNATRVVTYTPEQFSGWYEEFFLGRMWRNGDLGGVRYGS